MPGRDFYGVELKDISAASRSINIRGSFSASSPDEPTSFLERDDSTTRGSGRRGSITTPWDAGNTVTEPTAPADSTTSYDATKVTVGRGRGRQQRRTILVIAAVVLVAAGAALGAMFATGVIGTGGEANTDSGPAASSDSSGSVPVAEAVPEVPLQSQYYCRWITTVDGSSSDTNRYTREECASACYTDMLRRREYICCNAGLSSCGDAEAHINAAACAPTPEPACVPRPEWTSCEAKTPAHLSDASVRAQGTGFPLTVYPGGSTSLPLSADGQLLTLRRIVTSTSTIVGDGGGGASSTKCGTVTLARSYDGLLWEAVSGHFGVDMLCDSETGLCTVPEATAAPNGEELRIDAVPRGFAGGTSSSPFTLEQAAVRLLEQAAFGPTAAEIRAVLDGRDGSAPATAALVQAMTQNFLDAHMARDPDLLRAYIRRRNSPRFPTDIPQGEVALACEVSSRWRNSAFDFRDQGNLFVLQPDHSINAFRVEPVAGGGTRTEVKSLGHAVYTPGNNATHIFAICPLSDEFIGPRSVLRIAWKESIAADGTNMRSNRHHDYPCKGTNLAVKMVEHPPVYLTNPDASLVRYVNADDLTLAPVATPSLEPGSFVVKRFAPNLNCPSNRIPFMAVRSSSSDGRSSETTTTTTFYRYEPRIRMVENTPENPHQNEAESSDVGGSSGVGVGVGTDGTDDTSNAQTLTTKPVCIGQRKNFLNHADCKRVQSAACALPAYREETLLTLNHTTLRMFYETASIYVYKITGLRLEGSVKKSFCNGNSRWVRQEGVSCPTATSTSRDLDPLHAPTATAVRLALANSKDTHVKDVTVTAWMGVGESCYTSWSAVGAQLEWDGACWTHSHPKQGNVYDFTSWVKNHPGNVDRFRLGLSHPIESPAARQHTYITFPQSHLLSRFDSAVRTDLELLGKFGGHTTFGALPVTTRTPALAVALGAASPTDKQPVYACGSRGEVANDPTLGHYFRAFDTPIKYTGLEQKTSPFSSVNSAWTTFMLRTGDQLRQRVAHALYQIFPISFHNTEASEPAATYHDILAANAFTTYGQLLDEVYQSPAMGEWLSYRGNWRADGRGNFPDENMAREVMQLFTIGLFKTHMDGRYVLDNATSTPTPIDTYTNKHIEEMAKVWTGWDWSIRAGGNVMEDGVISSPKMMDPMELKPDRRDTMPKMQLNGGHLGDGWPLCSRRVRRHFLEKGAHYLFLGAKSALGEAFDNASDTSSMLRRGHFTPQPSSPLYQALCGVREARTGRCTFPDEVVLPRRLECSNAVECGADTLINVRVVDGPLTRYYHYNPAPCVDEVFWNNGKRANYWWAQQCHNPERVGQVGTACCHKDTGAVMSRGKDQCLYVGEPMSFVTAQARCAALDAVVCSNYKQRSDDKSDDSLAPNWLDACSDHQYNWRDQGDLEPCYMTVQVYPDGDVGIRTPRLYADGSDGPSKWFHPLRAAPKHPRTSFRVYWSSDAEGTQLEPSRYPRLDVASNSCDAVECEPADHADTAPSDGSWGCMCRFRVEITAVYTENNVPPPREATLRHTLVIGHDDPALYSGSHVAASDDEYVRCETSACRTTSGVAVWTRRRLIGQPFDTETVFELTETNREPRFLMNRRSVVRIASQRGGGQGQSSGGDYSFRNVPTFYANVWDFANHPALQPQSWGGLGSPYYFVNRANLDAVFKWRAKYETDALIRHLLHHDNTAPFVALRLIQRLVTSNPSSRYVRAVAESFRMGSYSGRTYSGRYGCMRATVAAVLLDPEARSATLDADVRAGKVREPVIKLLSYMRALDFRSEFPSMLVAMPNLADLIGQEGLASPSVFGWFDYDHAAEGAVTEAGMVAPEAKLLSPPLTIAMLNGLSHLVDEGLTGCTDHFGDPLGKYRCDRQNREAGLKYGSLNWQPKSPAHPAAVVDELNTRLLGGRMSSASRAFLIGEYEAVLARAANTPLLNARAQLSRQHGRHEASRAIDGNFDQNLWQGDSCAQASFGDDPWLFIELDGQHNITGVDVYIRSDCCEPKRMNGFDLYVNGRACATDVSVTQLGQKVSVPCVEPGARNINITLPRERAWLAVCEVVIHRAVADSQKSITADPNSGHWPRFPAAERDARAAILKQVAMMAEMNVQGVAPLQDTPRPTPELNLGNNRKLKSIILTALRGGADTFGMLLPYEGCTRLNRATGARESHNLYAEYAGLRGPNITHAKNRLLRIRAPPGSTGTKDLQPCEYFGISPHMPFLQQAYNDGDLAFVAGAGALVEPLTAADFVPRKPGERKRAKPLGVFGHNLMQTHYDTVDASDIYSTGILGRLVSKMSAGIKGFSKPFRTGSFSVAGLARTFRGAPTPPVLAAPVKGIKRFTDYAKLNRSVMELLAKPSSAPLADTYLNTLAGALRVTEAYGDMLDATDTSAPPAEAKWDENAASLHQQYKMAARALKMAREKDPSKGIGLERAAFFTESDGWDTHQSFDAADEKFAEVDDALRALCTELKAQGVWDDTIIMIVSDFGRTLTTNGRGTDHAYSGNYFLVGGGVRGGRVLGRYPEYLEESPDNLLATGRGRLIPEIPWEGMWKPLAQWWGMTDKKELEDLLPHLKNFPNNVVLEKADVFTN